MSPKQGSRFAPGILQKSPKACKSKPTAYRTRLKTAGFCRRQASPADAAFRTRQPPRSRAARPARRRPLTPPPSPHNRPRGCPAPVGAARAIPAPPQAPGRPAMAAAGSARPHLEPHAPPAPRRRRGARRERGLARDRAVARAVRTLTSEGVPCPPPVPPGHRPSRAPHRPSRTEPRGPPRAPLPPAPLPRRLRRRPHRRWTLSGSARTRRGGNATPNSWEPPPSPGPHRPGPRLLHPRPTAPKPQSQRPPPCPWLGAGTGADAGPAAGRPRGTAGAVVRPWGARGAHARRCRRACREL